MQIENPQKKNTMKNENRTITVPIVQFGKFAGK